MYIHVVSRSSYPLRKEAKALYRNAILTAAEIVFSERGFHAARIQDIAARARIAVGTVYNHFETKEDVLAALFEEHATEFADALEPQSSDPRGFEASLRVRVRRLLSYIDQHRVFFVFVADIGAFAGKQRAIERLRKAFRSIVDAGISAGALKHASPEILTRFFGMTVKAYSMSEIDGPLVDHADEVVDLFLRGAHK
jgi:AcrR family transcriptional regulator